MTGGPVGACAGRLGRLKSVAPGVKIDGVISMYRSYRDWWRALEVRRPGVAALIRGAAVVLGVLLGAVLTHSLSDGVLVGAVIGVTIAASWSSHRRRKKVARTDYR